MRPAYQGIETVLQSIPVNAPLCFLSRNMRPAYQGIETYWTKTANIKLL
jgi:hypothetical protein